MKTLIWDLPVRLFHWLLTFAFGVAFLIAIGSDDEGGLFTYHMLFGMIAAFLVLLRLVWAFIGPRTARLSTMFFSPGEVLAYLKGVFANTAPRYAAHNPGSGWAILLMLFLVLVTAGSGLMISTGSEVAEELHELAAFSLAAVVLIHIIGVVWHVRRHRENIVLSMIHGRKDAAVADGIESPRTLFGLIFLVLVGVFAGLLFSGVDAKAGTLSLPGGTTLQLGEGEEHEGEHDRHEGKAGRERDEHGHDKHDRDDDD